MGQPVSTKPMTHKNMLLSNPWSCFASCLSRQPFGAISWIRNIWQVYLAPFGVWLRRLYDSHSCGRADGWDTAIAAIGRIPSAGGWLRWLERSQNGWRVLGRGVARML